MELGKSEAFGILNSHHRGIGHIHTDFYHGSSHHNLGFVSQETLHFFFFLGRFHLAMHLADLVLWKLFADVHVTLFQIFDVHLFALLYQRIHDVYLTSFLNLFPHELVHAFPAVIKLMNGLDRLSAGRQLINDRHIQIAIQGHGQRTGNRGSCHNQYMRRTGILSPQLGSLGYSKTVLFVNHHQSQRREVDGIFNHSMRTNQDMHIPC